MSTINIPEFHAPDEQFAALIPEAAEELGIGTSRHVFRIEGHPDKVIKVALGSNAANWTEFVIYTHLDNSSSFGEILSISRSGKYLIMEYLQDIPVGQPLPDVPIWLTDRKRSAFGLSKDGNPKIRDYAQVNLALGYLVSMPSRSESEEMVRWIAAMSKK